MVSPNSQGSPEGGKKGRQGRGTRAGSYRAESEPHLEWDKFVWKRLTSLESQAEEFERGYGKLTNDRAPFPPPWLYENPPTTNTGRRRLCTLHLKEMTGVAREAPACPVD